MSDTRRLLVRKVLTNYLPNSACADCASVTKDYDLRQAGQPIPGRKVGDCEIEVMTQTVLSLFNAQVCMPFTHNKDVWHMRLRILSRLVDKPSQLYSWFDQTFAGPRMSEKDVPLFRNWSEEFIIKATGYV